MWIFTISQFNETSAPYYLRRMKLLQKQPIFKEHKAWRPFVPKLFLRKSNTKFDRKTLMSTNGTCLRSLQLILTIQLELYNRCCQQLKTFGFSRSCNENAYLIKPKEGAINIWILHFLPAFSPWENEKDHLLKKLNIRICINIFYWKAKECRTIWLRSIFCYSAIQKATYLFSMCIKKTKEKFSRILAA